MCCSRTSKYAKTRVKNPCINEKPRIKGKYDVNGGNNRNKGSKVAELQNAVYRLKHYR